MTYPRDEINLAILDYLLWYVAPALVVCAAVYYYQDILKWWGPV